MNISKHKVSKFIPLPAFAERLLQLMPRIMHSQVKQERHYLARGLITLPQLWALKQIAEMGACSMQTLARAQGLKSSTVTGLVDRLVKLGLLKRFTSPTDRRAVLASMTPKGLKIIEALHTERRQSIIRIFQHISPRERTLYLEIIEKIVQAISTPPGQNPAATSGERNK